MIRIGITHYHEPQIQAVNLRSYPDYASSQNIVMRIPIGNLLAIYHEQTSDLGQWYLVTADVSGTHYGGWLFESVVRVLDQNTPKPPPSSESGFNTGVNVDPVPSTLTHESRGINIDLHNNTGFPNVNEVGAASYMRQLYNVSQGTGNTDIDRAFNEYYAKLKPYLDAGKTIIFVLNHQTWGEGQNQWWENDGWIPPESPRWVTQFAPAYANFIGGIVAQWRPYSDQIIWQIWNEQDSPGWSGECGVITNELRCVVWAGGTCN